MAPVRPQTPPLGRGMLVLVAINLLALALLVLTRLEVTALSETVDAQADALAAAETRLAVRMDAERAYAGERLRLFERQTRGNFAELARVAGGEAAALRLDLEERPAEPAGVAEDFSDVIPRAQGAVVTVRTSNGVGSGFFFDASGYVMTNRHVVATAGEIRVVDSEGRAYRAELVGISPDADLAVLKVGGAEFEHLSFADEVQVGEQVIAVGNPLGLSSTVTRGIVSATGRRIDSTGVGYLQTDVAITRGSSGGPLLNEAGEVVGVNTLGIAGQAGFGFAIPSDIAAQVARSALEA